MSEPSPTDGYFLYQDAAGQLFVADTLDGIPEQYRSLAKRLSLNEAKAVAGKVGSRADEAKKHAREAKGKALDSAKRVQHEVGDVLPFVQALDLPSVAVGFAGALAGVLVFTAFRRTGKLIVKLGLLALVVMFLSGGYFGWLRRSAGLSEESFSSPTQLIDDAKDAAKQATDRLQNQEKTLKKLEEDM